MLAAVVAFLMSMLLVVLILKTAHLHGEHSADSRVFEVQKVHVGAVPRVGGLAIVVAFALGCVAALLRYGDAHFYSALTLVAVAIPAVASGLLEDVTKRVGPRVRLLATMASALLAAWVMGAVVIRADCWGLDQVLAFAPTSLPAWPTELPWSHPVALAFTVLVVAGVANACNIIDGLNGLAAMTVMMMFASIAYVAFRVGDTMVLTIALAMIGAIAGFFLFNFPAGLIFLGDGGAYFLGFMLAECVVLLVARNPDVSAWYAVLLLIYPVWETIFSIYRRSVLRKRRVDMPDAVHLHSLLFRRVMRWAVGLEEAKRLVRNNSSTSPFLWLLCALAVFPASLLFRHSGALIALTLIFCVSYVWLYASVVRFRTPRYLRRRR